MQEVKVDKVVVVALLGHEEQGPGTEEVCHGAARGQGPPVRDESGDYSHTRRVTVTNLTESEEKHS